MVPFAQVSHRTVGRMRIRIPSRKGDAEYFSHLQDNLTKRFGFRTLTVNHWTGSVLIVNPSIDPNAVADHAAENGLFDLHLLQPPQKGLAHDLFSPVAELNGGVRRFTGGELDLGGLVFIGLLIYGMVEIARGNLSRPPWYTALWYAFGLFTKSIVDRSEKSAP